VDLRYDLPAEMPLSQNIEQLAVAEFEGPTSSDTRWGQRVADKVVSTISDFNRSQRRFRVVDRRRLETIRKERDIQLAMGDPAAAARIGKIAEADAVIYGTCNVASEVDTQEQARLDPRTGRTTYQQVKVMTASVVVNFQMVRVSDGQTILAREEKASYDSRDQEDDDNGALGKISSVMGFGGSGDKAPSSEQVIEDLLGRCVNDFVSVFSPHTVRVTVSLEKGKEKDLVERGNKLASRGSYQEALDLYEEAIRLEPDDHETLFNAAVMHEALGDYAQAARIYDQAFAKKSQTKYLDGRQRAQRALEAADQEG
jgi:tetratricopeptide (TPR) repeat protein